MKVAVIQARMGSQRLPGKVLRPLGGRPVLSWVLRAATRSTCEQIIVATTWRPEDDEVADLANQFGMGVRAFQGDTDDVLSRFLAATSQLSPSDVVVRLTADNPLVDPALIDAAALALERAGADLCRIHGVPLGVGAGAVRLGALRRSDAHASGFHRAHVTSYIKARPEDYEHVEITLEPDASDLRVTLDTPEDARLLDALVQEFGDTVIPWRDLVSLLRTRPDLVALNAEVSQRPLAEG